MEMNKGKVSHETDHDRFQDLDNGNLNGIGICESESITSA